MSIFDQETGKPRLLSEQCITCVGLPGNVAGLRPGRLKQLISENSGPDGQGLICHSTIKYVYNDEDPEEAPRIEGENAFCRWYYDNYREQTNFMRICERLGGFTEVPPPSKESAGENNDRHAS